MIFRTLPLVLLLAITVTACGLGDDDDDPVPTPAPTAPLVTPPPTTTPEGASAEPTPTEEVPADPTTPEATVSEEPTATEEVPDEPTATEEPDATPTEAATPEPPALEDLNVGLEVVVEGLDQPDGFAVANDGQNRLFILEQPGRVRIVADGALVEQPFLDITERVGDEGSEQGLLGIAFHPNYSENGRFFLNYTDTSGNTVISEFTVTDDPNVADPDSERLILYVEQPASNHNGGHLVFGPDGYLWIGLGDGGAAGDRFGNAQNPATLLGAMLRIDVDGVDPYGVPADNPFIADTEARNEIWALGLRNPWRYSFDRETGDLYIADVGQGDWEEIHFTPAGTPGGLNFGWPILEGSACYQSATCATDGLELPVAEYDHAGGNCAVTGGYVYRGSAYPTLWGTYFYADYCSGNFWGLRVGDDGAQLQLLFQRSGALFSSFGEDEHGELYILSQATGALYRITGF